MPVKLTEQQRQKRIYDTARYIECCKRRRLFVLERIGQAQVKPEYLRWISMYARRMRKLYLRINRLSNPYERKQSMVDTPPTATEYNGNGERKVAPEEWEREPERDVSLLF